MKKCKFAKSHVKYLGHVTGPVELHVDMDKVALVRNQAPTVADVSHRHSELSTQLTGIKRYQSMVAQLVRRPAPL